MSLKGYEWLVDNKVVMSFRFKYLELDIWEDVSEEEQQKFINWLAEKDYKPLKINHYEKKK